MSLQAQLESLKEETIVKITAAQDLKELNQIRVETLGKKGPITEVLRGMKDLSPEERPKSEVSQMRSETFDRRNRAKKTSIRRRSVKCSFGKRNSRRDIAW